MDSKSGRFYGVPLSRVDAPVEYGRVIFGGEDRPEVMQFNFLASLEHKRFLQLQKFTGAYQGKEKMNRNQLLDAFHIWCAEHNKCEFFLTMDFKLIGMIENNRKHDIKVKLVRPSELLNAIQGM